jgi:CubicO group peptidase (beta-lactamase class C family)
MAVTDTLDSAAAVHGDCTPRFAAVRAALEENFAGRGEIGSAVSVYHEGRKVVDLWGGHLDAARTRPWPEDGMCLMYSVGKSMCALAVHMLADRGLVEIDAPVATYWPEFAQAGKDAITVRHILSHWCGVWRGDAASPGDIYDWAKMISVIEQQAPAWPAGTKGAYNTINIGFLTGEVVRRVTGRRIQDFVQDEICRPLGAQYYLGVPERELGRVADLSPNPTLGVRAAARDPDAPMAQAQKAFPKPFNTDEQNSHRFRTAGVPSIAGIGEARGMARIYAALAEGGELDGVRLLSAAALARATETQWSDMHEGLLNRPMAMAMGFMKNPPGGFPLFGPRADAFGPSGSGGARAFAVPSQRLAVCFASNYQSEKRSVGERTEAIVAAACAAAE